ncbi:MAG: hypothetical protein LBH03_05910, partial [Holophagales bacterium]|nr:hypothetical protein [Holophagales bacterium]
WSNEAKGKAAVHCVIIGFSAASGIERAIYDGEKRITAKNINAYLVDAPNTFVERNNAPQVKRADAQDCAAMERAAIGGERNGRRRRCLPVCNVCQGR